MAADEDSAKSGEKGEAGKPARRPRQPVTIDLPASVVAPAESPSEPGKADDESAAAAAAILGGEKEAASVGPAAAPSPTRPESRTARPAAASTFAAGNWVALFVAGLVGGLIVLLFGYGLGLNGAGSNEDAVEATTAVQKKFAETVGALDKRVAAIDSRPAPADPTARLEDLATKIGALEAAGGATTTRLDKVESGLAAIPPPAAAPQSLAATSQVLDDLLQRVDKLESAGRSGDAFVPPILGDRISALETSTAVLSGRLDALADQMQALAAKPGAAEDSEKAARAVAIGTLRQAAEGGGSFAADLAMIEALDIAPADVAALKPLADKGAPAKADLAAEFPQVSDAILAAAAGGAESGGIVDRLIAHARGLVTVRPVGPIAGETPAAIVSRMQAAVDKGDLAAALKEREGLPEPCKAASAGWAEGAADRVAIDRLVGKLVVALGAPRPAE